ncbi:hypothetical protein [Lentilactobacillus senioris]|uniref:hypothetical protein n=1 Tax=Lentilactobacillus senioris TaxID=931534 RepID=UPI000A58D544|nr:hypothetical protein [Lentilactobacillus senioris]
MKSVPARLAASVLIATFYMFIIAFEIAYVGNAAFWPTFWGGAYLTTAIGEFLAMTLGAVVLYFVNLRFDLSK